MTTSKIDTLRNTLERLEGQVERFEAESPEELLEVRGRLIYMAEAVKADEIAPKLPPQFDGRRITAKNLRIDMNTAEEGFADGPTVDTLIEIAAYYAEVPLPAEDS